MVKVFEIFENNLFFMIATLQILVEKGLCFESFATRKRLDNRFMVVPRLDALYYFRVTAKKLSTAIYTIVGHSRGVHYKESWLTL